MFEISFLLFIKALLLNIIIPIFTWILFLWIFFWNKFKGIIFYTISFFIWTWIIAFSLFNLQFLYFGIWITEYFVLNILLIIIFLVKVYIKSPLCHSDTWNKFSVNSGQNQWKIHKSSYIKEYLETLKIWKIDLKKHYSELKIQQKILFILWSIFIFVFSLITFTANTNFPSYFDDTFWNWNAVTVNTYYDGGVKMFWEENEILWRWRLGYPIYFPIYKALIFNFLGGVNDVYINLWQILAFIFFLIFVFSISFQKTKNLFFSTIPLILICWLPLIFFHAVDWYFDLACAIYSVFSIYFIYQFLENNDFDDLSLWLLFGFILTNVKNDWLIVYFAWIIIALLVYLFFTKKIIRFFKDVFKDKKFILEISFFVIYFLLPFIAFKSFLWLEYNPIVWEQKLLSFHPEIFNIFKPIFFQEDNYNLSLLFVILILFTTFNNFKNSRNFTKIFPVLSVVTIFLIFVSVFLLTNNYQWALDQTTINRVFTMCFVILFSFFWILIYEEKFN
jgi:hypothetical protein